LGILRPGYHKFIAGQFLRGFQHQVLQRRLPVIAVGA
jgi:TM2 domain-containing membrane protein YozV